MRSATYLNAKKSKEEKKRGQYVMRDKAYLVEKFGTAGADAVIETKIQLQAKRKDHEPIYVMDNPDRPGEDSWIKFWNVCACWGSWCCMV